MSSELRTAPAPHLGRRRTDPRRRLRVLFVLDTLEPSGAETSTLALIDPLTELGVDCHVAHFGGPDGLTAEFIAAGALVHRLHGKNRRARASVLTDAVEELGPDIVHTTLFEADIAGRIAGKRTSTPVISSIVNTAYGPTEIAASPAPRWKHRAARSLDARTARTVHHFHALSSTSADVMAERLGIDRADITVIPRGRDGAALGRRTGQRRQAARDELGYSDMEVVLVAAARHEPQKALDVLIDGFARAHKLDKTLRLAIAGREGSSTELLQQRIEHHDVADVVELLGPRDDVAELLCAADVFVLASRWEGFGSVLVEAMALEAPIVASNIEVFREVTRNGALSTLFTVDDPDSLAAGIREVIDHPETAAERVAEARLAFEHQYDINRVARRQFDLYQAVVMSLRLGDAT